MRVAEHFDPLDESAVEVDSRAEELLYYAHMYKIPVPKAIRFAMYDRTEAPNVKATTLRAWVVRTRLKFGGYNHAIVSQIVHHLFQNDRVDNNFRPQRQRVYRPDLEPDPDVIESAFVE